MSSWSRRVLGCFLCWIVHRFPVNCGNSSLTTHACSAALLEVIFQNLMNYCVDWCPGGWCPYPELWWQTQHIQLHQEPEDSEGWHPCCAADMCLNGTYQTSGSHWCDQNPVGSMKPPVTRDENERRVLHTCPATDSKLESRSMDCFFPQSAYKRPKNLHQCQCGASLHNIH